MCNCKSSMTKSSRINNSDCISRVYRIVYPERLLLAFILHQNNNSVSYNNPLTLIEVNGRVDYTLSGFHTNSEGQDIINSVGNSTVELKGSGLYHFIVNIIQKNTTYCDQQAEFIVYMDETPLSNSDDKIIKACTAVVFGFILLGLFLYQYQKTSHLDDLDYD